MGTPLQDVYDAFLVRIESEDWILPDELYIAQRDWLELLKIAIFQFRFPRIDLEIDKDNDCFVNKLTNSELQVLATYMKYEWVKRCVASWEEIKMLYSNKDFSQANHLDKLEKLSDQVWTECLHTAATYDRSRGGKPYDYRRFAGKSS